VINYLKVYYLNDKGLHDFEKQMISKLLRGLQPPAPPVATALDRV
jgi:hypothetical protein